MGTQFVSTELFNKAQVHLRLVDVFMRGTKVEVDESFDPRGLSPLDQLDSQFQHVIASIERLTPSDDSGADIFFRVGVSLAVRWGKGSDESDDPEDFNEMGRIEASFVAEYLQDSDLEEECLQAFAFRAPSFHVWPYWREFVASTCSRLNVPKIVLPPMQRPQNPLESFVDVPPETTSRVLYTPVGDRVQEDATKKKDKNKKKKN